MLLSILHSEMCFLSLLLFLVTLCTVFGEFCDRQSTDSCPSGNSIEFHGKVIREFLGIPFAEPPVGERRFLNPEHLSSRWKEPRDAKKYGPACMQQPKSGIKDYSEDCLYLNVWAPKRAVVGKGKPVMVYLYGGSFNMGSASVPESNGTVLSAEHDVIVVTASYRIGFMGYLYPDDNVNSNMGMRDQQMALQWVRDNIQSFDGDASNMTVFGHSAGAISAGILALSPITNPMVRRAILQSGTPYSFLRPDSPRVARTKTMRLSRFLNCTDSSSSSSLPDEKISQQAFNCLQAVPADLILSYAPQEKTHSIILPNPVFGDSFLESDAASLLDKKLQESRLKPVDMIIGFQKNDSEVFLMEQVTGMFGKNNEDKEITPEQALDTLSKLMKGKLNADELQKAIKHYFAKGDQMTSEQLKSTLIRLYGDLYIYCPSYFMAQSLIKSSEGRANVWMYELRSKMTNPKNKQCAHVCHGEEIPIVFGAPFLHPLDYDEHDRLLSNQVMNHWTQFAKSGSPGKEWIAFNESGKYLMLGKDDSDGRMSDEKFTNCDSFWRLIFDARK